MNSCIASSKVGIYSIGGGFVERDIGIIGILSVVGIILSIELSQPEGADVCMMQ